MTTVVLGWDGLDPDRLDEFGLAGAFAPHDWTAVDTHVNTALGKPHTYELWPSIITGVPPAEHGIHADDYIETGWNSRLLSLAARYSGWVPGWLRWRVGRLVRAHGAEYAFEGPDYYEAADVRTLFDNRGAVALGVPNYRSRHDDLLGLSMDRGAALTDYLSIETAADGTTIHRPSVAPGVLSMRLAAEAGEKLAAAAAALHAGPDLVFVWLGLLDSAGHVAPTVGDPEAWHRTHYEQAAAWTEALRSEVDGGEVLVVSDHGLVDGRHTERAVVGSDTRSVSHLEHVFDVYGFVDAGAAAGGSVDMTLGAGATDGVRDVRGELEALGYV